MVELIQCWYRRDSALFSACVDRTAMNDPAQVLHAMREFLDRVRRETPKFYLQAAIPPLKYYKGDQLQQLWNCQNDLLTQGKLYWGAIIQANGALMMPGKYHQPGEIVCSPDPIYEAHPDLLLDVASRIYDLKHTEPEDQELRIVADHITDERYRAFCERIPLQLTEGRVGVRYTVVFYREHLPHRMIGPSRILPILVHGRHNMAMILPGPLWLPELKEDWEPDREFLEAIEQLQASQRAKRLAGPVANITPAAIGEFRNLFACEKQLRYVRLAYLDGEQDIKLVAKKRSGDVEMAAHGLQLLIDADTARNYWGLTVDYIYNGERGGFVVEE